MNHQPSKADRLAADRLLKRAVTEAVTQLRSIDPPYRYMVRLETEKTFATAIHAADMLLGVRRPFTPIPTEETATC